MKAHNVPASSEEIVWRESQNIYQPARRALSDFLASVDLISRNEMPSGREDGSLRAFIDESCLKTMQRHAEQDILREQAGILCGQAFMDADRLYAAVTSALPVETTNDAAHFSFHEASWEGVWGRIENGSVIIGWYHTHPGLGIFLSATDLRTQKLHFPAAWQVAVVLDPVGGEFGVFAGVDGKPLSKASWLVYRGKR